MDMKHATRVGCKIMREGRVQSRSKNESQLHFDGKAFTKSFFLLCGSYFMSIMPYCIYNLRLYGSSLNTFIEQMFSSEVLNYSALVLVALLAIDIFDFSQDGRKGSFKGTMFYFFVIDIILLISCSMICYEILLHEEISFIYENRILINKVFLIVYFGFIVLVKFLSHLYIGGVR